MSSRINHAQLAAAVNEWVREIGVNAKHAAREAGASADDIASIDNDKEALAYLVAELIGGKTVPQFMTDEGLSWPAFAAWLQVEPKRYEAYQAALKDRSFIAKESLRDGWWKTARMVPEETASHSDVHKAREALAKDLKMFDDKASVTGGIHITFTKDDVSVL